MAEKTKIEWADATVNHWAGCTKVSPACDNCYAQRMAGRLWKVQWGAGQPRRQFVSAREMLEALDRKAQRIGKRLRVFHNSLSDMFDKEVPDGWSMDAFKAMADTPNLQHLVLTKRVEPPCVTVTYPNRAGISRARCAPGDRYCIGGKKWVLGARATKQAPRRRFSSHIAMRSTSRSAAKRRPAWAAAWRRWSSFPTSFHASRARGGARGGRGRGMGRGGAGWRPRGGLRGRWRGARGRVDGVGQAKRKPPVGGLWWRWRGQSVGFAVAIGS